MSRTVSARIPKELHEELREQCNKLGCNINDFIAESIKFSLYGSSDFDFGFDDEEASSITNEPKTSSEVS